MSSSSVSANTSAGISTNKPLTLLKLFGHLIKGYIKSIPSMVVWMIVRAVLSFIIVFILHTYLVVYVNEGFTQNPNSPIYKLIAFPGTRASAMAFWSIAAYLLSSIAGRIWFQGPLQFFSDLVSFPNWTIKSFKRAKGSGLSALLFGIAIALLISLIIKNNYIIIIAAIGIFFSFTQQKKGLLFLLLSTGLSDIKRIFKKKRLVNHGIISVFIFGLILGLIISLFVPSRPLGHIFAIIICIAGIILTSRKKVSPITIMFALLFMAANTAVFIKTGVFADDGGWKEAGSTFSSWFNSAGSGQAMTMALPPALLSLFTSLFGGSNVPKPPPIPDVMDYNVDGWKWKNENGRWLLYQTDADGNTYGTGLTQGIFEGSDENFGNMITMYTTPTCDYDGFEDKTNTALENFGEGYFEHFTRDGWRAMDNSQREATLGVLSRQIADIAGIDPNNFNFTLVNDPSRGLNGSWNPGSRTLEINSNSQNFDNPLRMIQTVAHEIRHAAQGDPTNDLGGSAEYRSLMTWNDQNENYRSAGTDFTRYSGQLLERDADGFGRAVSRTFYRNVLASQ